MRRIVVSISFEIRADAVDWVSHISSLLFTFSWVNGGVAIRIASCGDRTKVQGRAACVSAPGPLIRSRSGRRDGTGIV